MTLPDVTRDVVYLALMHGRIKLPQHRSQAGYLLVSRLIAWRDLSTSRATFAERLTDALGGRNWRPEEREHLQTILAAETL